MTNPNPHPDAPDVFPRAEALEDAAAILYRAGVTRRAFELYGEAADLYQAIREPEHEDRARRAAVYGPDQSRDG